MKITRIILALSSVVMMLGFSTLSAQTSAGGAFTALNSTLTNPSRIAQQSKFTAFGARLPYSSIYTDSIWLTSDNTMASLWQGDVALDLGNGHAIGLGLTRSFTSIPSPEEGFIYSYDRGNSWRAGVGYRYRNKQNLALGASISVNYLENWNDIVDWVERGHRYWGQGPTINLGIHKITQQKDHGNGWSTWEYGFSLSNLGGRFSLTSNESSNPFIPSFTYPVAQLNGGLSYQRHLLLGADDRQLDLILNYELIRPLNGSQGDMIGRIFNSFSDDDNEFKTMQHQLGLQTWLTMDKFRIGLYNTLLLDPQGEYGFPAAFDPIIENPAGRLHFSSGLILGYDPILAEINYESFGGPEGNSVWTFGLGMRIGKGSAN